MDEKIIWKKSFSIKSVDGQLMDTKSKSGLKANLIHVAEPGPVSAYSLDSFASVEHGRVLVRVDPNVRAGSFSEIWEWENVCGMVIFLGKWPYEQSDIGNYWQILRRSSGGSKWWKASPCVLHM